MNLIITNIFFSILSIILVLTSPRDYSYNFCELIGYLFIIQNIIYFYFDDKKNIVCFEFFFALSFGLTNFVYPIFYFQTNPHISLFAFPFNESVISKATALAYLGYTSFLLGTTKLINLDRLKPEKADFKFNITIFQIFFIISIVTFILYMYFGGLDAIKSVYSGKGDITKVGLYSYFNNLFTISCFLLAIFIFKLNKNQYLIYLVFIAFFSILILTTGSRSFILGLGLILIVGYNNNVKKISFPKIALIIFSGAILLFFIVNVRSTDFNDGKWFSISNIKIKSVFDMFMDLIINNRNLYVLTDYADKNQLTFFNGMLVDIFSPIPGITSLLAKSLNKPVELITGGDLPTYLQYGTGSSFGLGTNMIGEAYIAFGTFGVFLLLFLIGYIIKLTYYASRYNIYAYVVYYLFISHAVFYPRAPILFNPRLIVWSLLLILLTYSITKYQKQTIEHD